MIKLGIIGAGKIIESHISAAKQADFLPVAIVARDNSESVHKFASKEANLEPCRNLDEFFTKNFDAILIATSEDSKAEILSRSVGLKKPILVEKPLYSRINYNLMKSLENSHLVKVGYNRRNYSSVNYLKHKIQDTESGLIHVNLPELSWIPSPNKNLVEESAYTNSIHVIDLLSYLLLNFQVTKVIKDKGSKSFNRIVHFESEKFVGTINFTFGNPDTYSLKLHYGCSVLELDPLEVFSSFNSISKKTVQSFSRYTKNLNTNWEMSEEDINFKPGFVRQYMEFSKFIADPTMSVNLATISDDEKAFEIMNQILENI
jgi:predicted dehydrogenase